MVGGLILNLAKQLKRYALSTSISRSIIDLPGNIEAKLFINPLLYTVKWDIFALPNFREYDPKT